MPPVFALGKQNRWGLPPNNNAGNKSLLAEVNTESGNLLCNVPIHARIGSRRAMKKGSRSPFGECVCVFLVGEKLLCNVFVLLQEE